MSTEPFTAAAPATRAAPDGPSLALAYRLPNPYRQPRRAAFYGAATGHMVVEAAPRDPLYDHAYSLDCGTESAAPLLHTVATLPEAKRPRIVFVCAPADAAPDEGWYLRPLAHGWSLMRWHNQSDHRTAVYARDGLEIDVRVVSPWFGESDAAEPATHLAARNLLRRHLAWRFGQRVDLLNTPGMTGGELLEMTLPRSLVIPTLPEALREEIRAFSTQGRREVYPDPGDPGVQGDQYGPVDNAWLLDSVFQYAACLSHLPIGRVVRDTSDAYAGYAPGFYRVHATPPRGWSHVGLLPYRESDGSISYPRTPGASFDAWVTSAELALAMDPEQGNNWDVAIRERVLWPDTHRLPDAAKNWIRYLREIRAALLTPPTDGSGTTAPARLAAGAVRHLVIDTIGRWNATAREEWGLLPLARINELPPGAIPHIVTLGGGYSAVSYMRPARIDATLLRFSHPEWAATVWGRSRARTADMLTSLPYGTLLRTHTDGIWAALSAYDLMNSPAALATRPERMTPGAWRVKGLITGPFGWPADEGAWQAIVGAAERDGRYTSDPVIDGVTSWG